LPISTLFPYTTLFRSFSFKMAPEGTYFQRKVWKQLLNIPFGTTVSYLNLAQDLGDVKAIRAVASANGRNPLWIAVPCHRVIGSRSEEHTSELQSRENL